jgi:N-methylhydantoinase B
MKHGDLIKVTVGGGAGCGDPLERDPRAVYEDVAINRFVSIGAARERYGVVIDATTLALDAEATERLRASIRAARANV